MNDPCIKLELHQQISKADPYCMDEKPAAYKLDSPPVFKVAIARTTAKDKELWPETICGDQMLEQTLAAAIIRGAYTHIIKIKLCEAAFALLMHTLNVFCCSSGLWTTDNFEENKFHRKQPF